MRASGFSIIVVSLLALGCQRDVPMTMQFLSESEVKDVTIRVCRGCAACATLCATTDFSQCDCVSEKTSTEDGVRRAEFDLDDGAYTVFAESGNGSACAEGIEVPRREALCMRLPASGCSAEPSCEPTDGGVSADADAGGADLGAPDTGRDAGPREDAGDAGPADGGGVPDAAAPEAGCAAEAWQTTTISGATNTRPPMALAVTISGRVTTVAVSDGASAFIADGISTLSISPSRTCPAFGAAYGAYVGTGTTVLRLELSGCVGVPLMDRPNSCCRSLWSDGTGDWWGAAGDLDYFHASQRFSTKRRNDHVVASRSHVAFAIRPIMDGDTSIIVTDTASASTSFTTTASVEPTRRLVLVEHGMVPVAYNLTMSGRVQRFTQVTRADVGFREPITDIAPADSDGGLWLLGTSNLFYLSATSSVAICSAPIESIVGRGNTLTTLGVNTTTRRVWAAGPNGVLAVSP